MTVIGLHNSGSQPQPDLGYLKQAVGDGPVLILTHHNPDPDALAAGDGLAFLLEQAWGLESRKVYSGLVARAENIAMLRHLTPGWEAISSTENVASYPAIALVDTQPGAGNNILPPDVASSAVFDHHQPVRPRVSEATYLYLRPEVGATATLVFQHLQAAKIEVPSALGTALFYGIKTDTSGLSRGASTDDEDAYLQLRDIIDRTALVKVEHAQRPAIYFQGLIDGLRSARVYGSVVIARIGDMHRPDFAAELADDLIRLEGAQGVLCMGHYHDTLYLSIRTVPLGEDAGLLIQEVVAGLGKGGGHGIMAGGQVVLDEHEQSAIETELVSRFLKVMEETGTVGTMLAFL